MGKGFILSRQESLFGSTDVIGFGSDEFHVREIDRDLANQIVVTNHYSKKFYSASYIHLGVFLNGEIAGVMQFGYAMNPASAGSVVTGTGMKEYLELNRMWLDDICPRNSESMALSYAIKYIKRKYPAIKWIQSFADERCGGFGIVYQACSFDYYGEHTATFWELDGEMFHNSIMTDSRKANTPKGAKLTSNKEISTKHTLRQFRYIKFIDERVRRNCTLTKKPYPKHYLDGAK